MSVHRGYVKLWRKSVDSPIWNKDPLYLKVFTYILFKATHKGNIGKRHMPLGTCTITEAEIAEGVEFEHNNRCCQPTKKVIRTILHWLESEKMITREAWAHNYTTLTVCNWELYQSTDDEPGRTSDPTFYPTADPTPYPTGVPLLKNGKNEKHEQLPPIKSPKGDDTDGEKVRKGPKERVEASPHLPYLTKLGTWFHNLPHTVNVKEGSPDWFRGLDACRLILDTQMAQVPAPNGTVSPEDRLRKLLTFAVADTEFWQAQVRSLAGLAVKKGNGLPKWANIEAAIHRHHEPKTVSSETLDALVAAEKAAR